MRCCARARFRPLSCIPTRENEVRVTNRDLPLGENPRRMGQRATTCVHDAGSSGRGGTLVEHAALVPCSGPTELLDWLHRMSTTRPNSTDDKVSVFVLTGMRGH